MLALMGNPNVGKSSLFNALTGMRQHTGNWPGKTVSLAQGQYRYKGRRYELIDLPGTYSLLSQSEEEKTAVEYLRTGNAACVIVVVDACCMERNLSLVLQVMELYENVIVCVNLLDEAQRRGITVGLDALGRELGVPVVGTCAASGEGLDTLREAVRSLCDGFLPIHPRKVGLPIEEEVWNQKQSDRASRGFAARAEEIAARCVTGAPPEALGRADRLALGRWSGRGLMLLMLFFVFWLTIQGANVPSALLQRGFDWCYDRLAIWMALWPENIRGLLLDGVFWTASRVISVMLPPMAIFFPLFSLLEDLGYLPRAALLMDHSLQRCGSCGKQVLTMSMGFGCNAAGVMGCRIISSPKERLLAIVTNAFVPCNGKFPALIVLISLFFSQNGLLGAAILTGFVVLGVAMTLLATRLLSRTLFRETESRFILELPTYRMPQWRVVLLRAFWDRTLLVLGRAAVVAAPAGAVLWLLRNWSMGGTPCLTLLSNLLDPAGRLLGMNGVILLAFFLAFPANELFLPCVVMLLSGGAMGELEQGAMGALLLQNGWSWKTALCTCVFLLLHWPCSTTCLTIRKETGSYKWTLLAMLLPTAFGVLLCGILAGI